MTTRPIRTTRTMPLNSPRTTTPGNRDPLNHNTPLLPLPSMYRTTPFIINPTTTLLMVLPLTPFRIQRRRSGMARRGLPSVSPWLHRRPFKRHPCLPPSVDRNLRPSLHLRLHRHQHQHPRPSAYMLLPPSHSPTRRRGEPQGHPRPPIRRPNPGASRGRKKWPFLGMPHRWRRQLR
jgi:hypothetical protein